MGALSRSQFAITEDFQNTVKYFMQKAAIAVMSESDATANHAARLNFARKILSGQASIYEFAFAVVTNATIGGHIDVPEAIPDADLEFTVNSMYDAFSL